MFLPMWLIITLGIFGTIGVIFTLVTLFTFWQIVTGKMEFDLLDM